ncbi:MAG: hypothetical protein HYY30_11965 [Chloroflexi bacterium]|nr:hypothetical protein [Chloroflexota bacterium]
MSPKPNRDHPYRQELYRVLGEREWLDANIHELQSKYAGRWIGLHDHQVLAVADTPAALKEEFAKKGITSCRMVLLVPTSIFKPV